EHLGDCTAVLSVPLKDLVGFGETVAVQHQPHQHLLTIRPLITRVAPPGLPVSYRLPLKVGRGQIVEVNRLVEMEQLLLAGGEFPFDLLAMRMQPVKIAVERVLGERGKLRPPDVSPRLRGETLLPR